MVRTTDLELLPGLATYHGVAGCVYASLRDVPGTPPDVLEALAKLYHAGLSSHLRILADLQTVGRLLDAAEVPWLVVKGPALAAVTYERPDLRTYHDLDLVVPPERFGELVRYLEAHGMPVLDRNWQLVRAQRRGQLHLALPHGTTTDLHWHLVNSRRERFRIPMSDLFARARTVEVPGVTCRVLDPVDSLLHLCLHAALSGGDRLIWQKDIEQTILHEELDWGLVVDRSNEWQVRVPVGVMLWRTANSLGVQVPPEVLAALLPSWPWRVALRALDRWTPAGSRFDEASLARLLSRNLGRGAGAVLMDAGRWAWRGLHGGAHERDVRSNPMLVEHGNEEDRAAYLAAVAAEGDAAPRLRSRR
jgi:hypothetical protein